MLNFASRILATLLIICPFNLMGQSGADSDADGLPDAFEDSHGLNPAEDDRYKDFDGDGYPNLAEFLNNSDPADEQSLPENIRLVGSTEYPNLTAALVSAPPLPDGAVVVLPQGRHTLPEGGVTLPGRAFLMNQTTDAFATVIEAHASGDLSNTGLIVANGDLYMEGVLLEGRGAAGTGVRLMHSGHSLIVRCAFLKHLTAVQSGTSALPCDSKVVLEGCLVTWAGSEAAGRCYGLQLHGDHQLEIAFSTIVDLPGSPTLTNEGMSVWIDAAEAEIILTNSILWNAGGTEIWSADLTPATTVGHSYMKNSPASVGPQTDLIMKQGFLLPNSPCIDAASLAGSVPAIDIRGVARPANGVADIGAHEYIGKNGLWDEDLDGDGVKDWDELSLFSSRFHLADTDGDAVNDGEDARPVDANVQRLTITVTHPASIE